MPNHLLEKKGSNINGGQLAQLLLKMNRQDVYWGIERYVLMKKTTKFELVKYQRVES